MVTMDDTGGLLLEGTKVERVLMHGGITLGLLGESRESVLTLTSFLELAF